MCLFFAIYFRGVGFCSSVNNPVKPILDRGPLSRRN